MLLIGSLFVDQLKPKGFGTHGNGKKHPVFEKKGITEDQMNISVKGNNDTIRVVGKEEFDRDVRNGKGFNVHVFKPINKNLHQWWKDLSFQQRARILDKSDNANIPRNFDDLDESQKDHVRIEFSLASHDFDEAKRHRLFIIVNKKDKNYELIANDLVHIIDANGRRFDGRRRDADIKELTGGLVTPFRKAMIV